MKKNIKHILNTLEIAASDLQVQRLLGYCEMVMDTNPRVNITGAKRISAFVEGPLFDALTLVTVMTTSGRLVDIGSGGGLPAVPLGILKPDIQLTMVEPRKKRADFLQQVVGEFSLNAVVLPTQDRELADVGFDGASAQAVFPPVKWIARARKLVRRGGAIYTLTSMEIEAEMLPNRVMIETQSKFCRNMVFRYASRLRVGL